jgi:DMSO/TMAO reductase YedYZ molybdopterin-dependent catalytic subunit
MQILASATLLLLGLGASVQPHPPAAVVEVTGAVATPLRLTASNLAAMPRAAVETRSDGITVTYEGVWLHEVLKRAGVPTGTELRGKALASYVIAEAQDGYQVVFSLAELDPMFTDNSVLLADTANGKPLSGAQGSFRLVTPKEKRGARAIRMLTRLEFVQLRK